ncbi:MAG TPA: RNA-binding protein [Candidatus Kapabacteria bacterium]|nr:RNA-binding protein [Candidatus Kapabacteria bacterium]
MNIYVGNIPYTVTEDDLRQVFEEFGTVTSTSVIIDNVTGRSRGFGFVQMATDEEGARAIEEMNGREWMGRVLTVNEARPRQERTGGYAPRRDGDGGGTRRQAGSYDGGGRSGGYSGGGGGGYGGGGYGGGGGRGGDRSGGRDAGRGRGDRDRGGRGRGQDDNWDNNRWGRGGDDDY